MVAGWRGPAPQERQACEDSPVHKAVPPVETARVDKVDAFFEVLFAREDRDREGSAGGAGLPGVASSPLTDSKRSTTLGPQCSQCVQ